MVKLYYCREANFGDAASPLLVEHLLGHDIRYARARSADLYAVGSILYGGEKITASSDVWRPLAVLSLFKHLLRRMILPTVHVWGSGFIRYPHVGRWNIKTRRMVVHALRGKRSLEILRGLGYRFDDRVPLGDPGLLYDSLLNRKESRPNAYDIGVIPHVSEVDNERIRKLLTEMKNRGLHARVIDVREPPPKVISDISSCRTILSSSLHGCIVADSLHIPNRHLVMTTLGLDTWEDFILKFNDYYSAYGLAGDKPLAIEEAERRITELPSLLDRTTLLSWDMVEERKEILMNAFPRKFLEPL